MMPIITPASIESGPDEELSRVACGRRGLSFLRLEDGTFAVAYVDFDGDRIEKVRNVLRLRPYEVPRVAEAAQKAERAYIYG